MTNLAGFDGVQRLFPEGFKESIKRSRGGCMTELSGKLFVLDKMLASIRSSSNDRIVLISSYTQTLDLFSALCRERGYPCLRLDGNQMFARDLFFIYNPYVMCQNDLNLMLKVPRR
jgi:SNF2 family DNA or RNA helicase